MKTQKPAEARSYKKYKGKHHKENGGARPVVDDRTARQLRRHSDLMFQYREVAAVVQGRSALVALPGHGCQHDPFMFRPVHKDPPRFRSRPQLIHLSVAGDQLVLSEVESVPVNGKLVYSVKRSFDFALRPVRGAQAPALDGAINHVLLTQGNNLLQELVNTADQPAGELTLPQLVILVNKVRVDEGKLAKLVSAIEPPELRPMYAQKRRESAEVYSLGELFGDAALLADAEIAAGFRQERAFENYEPMLGAHEINPARKVFMARNPAREVLQEMNLPVGWAEQADEQLFETLFGKMRALLPLPEMATDSDLLDGLAEPGKPINFSVPVDHLPSSAVIRAMRAALPPGKAVVNHVTDDELLVAARKPYDPLVVNAYAKVQVFSTEALRTLPTYAAGSFFPQPKPATLELAAE
jgi:hypothetical protein